MTQNNNIKPVLTKTVNTANCIHLLKHHHPSKIVEYSLKHQQLDASPEMSSEAFI